MCLTKIFKYFLLLILLVWILGCENPSEYKHKPKLVVNGELVAGQSIDSIFVTWSADISEKYDTKEQRVKNADVQINGVRLTEYEYSSGVYYHPDRNFKVKSGETYQLTVQVGTEIVTSQTTVPQLFRMIPVGATSGDTVQYVPGKSWFSEAFFTLKWPDYKNSKIFRIVSAADIATLENFIEDNRTEANVFKGEKEDRENPAIWWVADDYARINWMYFNWTGWHNIIVSAVDENYYNYRNGVLFGEQYVGQNFNSVVNGGFGLFCSTATDTIRIYLME